MHSFALISFSDGINSFIYSSQLTSTTINPFSANLTKWSNTLKQFVSNCLSVFDHFVGLALKGLISIKK